MLVSGQAHFEGAPALATILVRPACFHCPFRQRKRSKQGLAKGRRISPQTREIRLVLTQANPAIDQYKPLIDQEQQMLDKEGAEAVSKDREVVTGLELAIKSFREEVPSF